MTHRSHRSPQERDARSRAVQLLADKPLLRGSLVLQHRCIGLCPAKLFVTSQRRVIDENRCNPLLRTGNPNLWS